MITLPLLALAVLYMGLLVWVSRKLKSWPARIAVLLVLLSPVIYWVGTYQYVQYEHKQACTRDGGLKVLIQPEKADRIQLNPDSFKESAAQDLLFQYSPRLAVVEAWEGKFDGSGTGRKVGYFAYSLDPATTSLPKKDWKFNKVSLAESTTGLYVLSESAKVENNLTTTTWKLERNGQLYATWTMYHHYWTRNPGMPIGWQCFAPVRSESSGQYPHKVLTELILK